MGILHSSRKVPGPFLAILRIYCDSMAIFAYQVSVKSIPASKERHEHSFNDSTLLQDQGVGKVILLQQG